MSKPKEDKQDIKSKMKRVHDAMDFASKLVKNHSAGAEAFMMSLHVVRDGRIHHYHNYQDFPNADWGPCIIANSVEARNAQMNAQTGMAKIAVR